MGIFALAYNLSRFFELSLLHCHSALYNATVIQVLPSSLRRHPQYVEFYLGWSYTGVMLVVPFLLLIAMNIRVILAVHRTRKRHQYEMCRTDDNSNNGAKEAAKERSTTVMLVGIVVVFLVCNFLALLANILEILMKADERLADAISGPYEQIVSLSNLLVLVNMSVNSLIYLSFSDRYRTLLRYFCSYVRHRGADRWMLDSLPN